jgi:hypothetical protein
MLFQMRYRKPFGAISGLIEARDLATAERVGRTYCDQQGFRYIAIELAVLATEAILGTSAPAIEPPRDPVVDPARAEPKRPPKVDTSARIGA